MKVSREQADQHLQAGRPVAFAPKEGAPRTLQVPEGGRRTVAAQLPAEGAKGEYLLLRDEKGNLTRAGMEQALREGGSVLLDGRVIEHRDDLPTEADLAKGDERREAQVREQLDTQIAALLAQRSRLEPTHHEGVQQAPAGPPAEALTAPAAHPPARLPGQHAAPSSGGPGQRRVPGRPTGRDEGKKED